MVEGFIRGLPCKKMRSIWRNNTGIKKLSLQRRQMDEKNLSLNRLKKSMCTARNCQKRHAAVWNNSHEIQGATPPWNCVWGQLKTASSYHTALTGIAYPPLQGFLLKITVHLLPKNRKKQADIGVIQCNTRRRVTIINNHRINCPI